MVIILGGDFNEVLEEEGNDMRRCLERNNMRICRYEGASFERQRADRGEVKSKIDYLATTRDAVMKTRVISSETSDHNLVMAEIKGKRGNLRPRRLACKEMFFSNTLNEIKKDDIKHYMRYILQVMDRVMNGREGMCVEEQEILLEELKGKIPIVEINRPRKIYDVERKIDEMMKKGVGFKKINKEIGKLRKYSFQAYIKKNLKALSVNPKAYHRCLQNVIGWNLSMGEGTAIKGDADMDPQQIYEDAQGRVFHGEEAKEQV